MKYEMHFTVNKLIAAKKELQGLISEEIRQNGFSEKVNKLERWTNEIGDNLNAIDNILF